MDFEYMDFQQHLPWKTVMEHYLASHNGFQIFFLKGIPMFQ